MMCGTSLIALIMCILLPRSAESADTFALERPQDLPPAGWCSSEAPLLAELSASWLDSEWKVSGDFTQWNTSRVDVIRRTEPYCGLNSSAGIGFRVGRGGVHRNAHGLLLLAAPQAGFQRFSSDQGTPVYARAKFQDNDRIVVHNMIPLLSWFEFLDVNLLQVPLGCAIPISDLPAEIRSDVSIPWDRNHEKSCFLAFSSPSAPTATYYAEIVIDGPMLGSWIAYRNTGKGYGLPIIATIARAGDTQSILHFHKEVPMQGGALISEWAVTLESVDLRSEDLLTIWADGDSVPFLEGGVADPRPGVIASGHVELYAGKHRGPLPASRTSALGIVLLIVGAVLLVLFAIVRRSQSQTNGGSL